MKDVQPCMSCSLCAVKLGFGFIGEDSYFCTLSGVEVEDGDGCTLGEEGDMAQAVDGCEVDAPNLNDYGDRW